MPTPALTVADQLAALGVKVPAALTEARKVLEAAHAYAVPEPPDVNTAALTVTAKDVPKVIEGYVEAEIRRTATQVARGDLIDRLERRCHRALLTETDNIVASLADVFTTAAEGFENAYAKLPPAWQDDSAIVRAGTDALQALTEAQWFLPTLEACRSIYRELGLATTPVLAGTAYTTVTDSMVAEEIAGQPTTGSLGWFGNARAVKGCTGLQWHKSQDAHRTYLANIKRTKLDYVRDTESGFGGHRLAKVDA